MNEHTGFTFKGSVRQSDPLEAAAFLAHHTGLSKARIKDAMNKGAVWVRRKGKARERLRRVTATLKGEDTLEIHYDPVLLSIDPPKARCMMDRLSYSIWHKPAGLLTEGTDYGDHCSLLRQVEIAFTPRRKAFPVHRLDREAGGLVLVAHTSEAARELSKLFRGREVRKRYRVEVLGKMDLPAGVIDLPLDNKPAATKYSVLLDKPDEKTSVLMVEMETGRLHQIRRHLAGIGHPVMGDPRYGRGNKDNHPMRLLAIELSFQCPFTGQVISCKI